MVKQVLITAVVLCAVLSVNAKESITHEYKFKMINNIPKIYDNMQSLGYRKYTTQRISGLMDVTYFDDEYTRPTIALSELVNLSHKISGANVTYGATVNNDYEMEGVPTSRINLIGDNKKNKFTTASVVFYADMEPSYNVGEDDEDNSLLCTFAGKGTTSVKTIKAWEKYTYTDANGKKKAALRKVTLGKYRIITTMRGYNAGTLGCGCHAYGHVSPTRVAGALGPTDTVDDIAATWGTWRATYYQTYYIP